MEMRKLNMEDIDKLDQLDRIEFRQRAYFLDSKSPSIISGITDFLYKMVLLIILVLQIAIITAIKVSVDAMDRILLIVPKLISISIVVVLLLALFGLIEYSSWTKNLREWYNKFFKIDTIKHGKTKKRN